MGRETSLAASPRRACASATAAGPAGASALGRLAIEREALAPQPECLVLPRLPSKLEPAAVDLAEVAEGGEAQYAGG